MIASSTSAHGTCKFARQIVIVRVMMIARLFAVAQDGITFLLRQPLAHRV